MGEDRKITWDMIEQVIDETSCSAYSDYLLQDIECLRYNYVEEDRSKAWFRFKRTFSDLYSDETWNNRIAKRFKYV
jgi:hypothetical protein